jgi:hypothetical protein
MYGQQHIKCRLFCIQDKHTVVNKRCVTLMLTKAKMLRPEEKQRQLQVHKMNTLDD